ncbi:MAG: hypothetical protein J2P37_02645 [Ktedonobacteraceae bacterium]|nr:hypothetical protein [Ktedonobacteraceae bacterium]MBO0790551.1 hypothetical protein [Ktedonobacteraceae bacterium]
METSKGKQGKWPNQWVQAAPFSQTQNQASEDAQAALRWPSLPEDVQPAVTSTSQDWDMMRRIWERQQRLNEEQRGSSWNV